MDLADILVIVGVPPFLDLELGVTACAGTSFDIEKVLGDFDWNSGPWNATKVLAVIKQVKKALTFAKPDITATKTLDFSISAGVSADLTPGISALWVETMIPHATL